MTTSPSAPIGENWRRRLRSAASLVVLCCIAALTLIALRLADGSQADDPPPGRVLPARALGAERSSATSPVPQPSKRGLVNVVDREAARPRRIYIPAIHVSARIVPLRREPDGTMQTPDKWGNTGWYEPGSEPGERGPAVIAGHIDSTSGPAVFYRLRELRAGEPDPHPARRRERRAFPRRRARALA